MSSKKKNYVIKKAKGKKKKAKGIGLKVKALSGAIIKRSSFKSLKTKK